LVYTLPFTGMKDARTFEELFLAHYDDVCSVARRQGVPAADADDVAQEAFLKFHEVRPRYGDECPPEALLLGITKNKARDHRKTDPQRKPAPYLELAEPKTPEQELRTTQAMLVLYKLVQGLPEELRLVYLRAEIEGQPRERIARELSIPVGTVGSRLHEARARMHASIEGLARRGQLPAILVPLLMGSSQPKARGWVDTCWHSLAVGLAAITPALVPPAAAHPDARPAAVEAAPEALATTGAVENRPAASGTQAVKPAVAAATDPAIGAVEPETATGAAEPDPRRRSPDSSKSGERSREMSSLNQIDHALRAGDIPRARSELARHRRQYPKGYLSQECDALAALIARMEPPAEAR
jgi:RNA polymerase sigma-70 factor (ECF subfamily)